MNPATRGAIISLLGRTKLLLARPQNDFSYSSFQNAAEARAEIDALLARVLGGDLDALGELRVLFAPAGPIQEVSLRSGWGDEFMAVAAEFDAIAKRIQQEGAAQS